MNIFAVMYGVRAGGTYILLLLLFILYVILFSLKQESIFNAKELKKYLIYDALPTSETVEINKLKLKIQELNARSEVRNCERFGPLEAHTTLLVVRVHHDVRRLQYLIVSLAQVRYISSVLLVFSHGYYNEHLNRLIRRISFCRVTQIFYPHSLQLHPNIFPGIDPEDCVNGSRPTNGTFCEERDARQTERKQHWWWTANFVFGELPCSHTHTGTVIFLEEGQYVVPDVLHMLQYTRRSLSYFAEVEIMSFGGTFSSDFDTHLLTLEYWGTPFDAGLAFDKTVWKKILALSSFYCMHDDCSWSRSLLNVFKNFPKGHILTVACAFPRVISTERFDNLDLSLIEISSVVWKSRIFPEKVKAVCLFGPEGRIVRDVKFADNGSGGWSDLRDQLLCLDPLTSTTTDYDPTMSTVTL